MIRYPIIFLTFLALTACSPQPTGDPQELMQIDREFSAFSKQHGAPAAWAAYFAQDSVQLSAGVQPVTGLDSILEGFAEWPPDALLTWEPVGGDVSTAGDLGFTWGRYVLVVKDEHGNDVVTHGKYTSIWKRQAAGTWKIVLDIGNENPPPNPLP